MTTITIFKSDQAINQIKPYLSRNPIIIEAGAFDGRDTQRLAQAWPEGTVHAFEPVPELFERLKKNTAHLPNVRCYQLALSDKEGVATFYVSEKPHKPGISSQAGSLRKPKERLSRSPIHFPYTIEVETITLAMWAQIHTISHVDFLWLDMQGHELNALKSADFLLSSISVIYTEVGFIEAYEQQPSLETVKKWALEHGFHEIGRTFANQTDWFFGNILLINNKNTKIIYKD